MFARRQVIFKPISPCKVTYNYQYDIMKTIYYYLTVADEVKGRFLHEEGFRTESGHVYKLFTYALLFNKAKFDEDTINLNKDSELRLIVSGKEDIIALILKGLLHIKQLKIGEEVFRLTNIEEDKKFKFQPIMLYKGLTPIIESTKNDNNGVVYLSPYESDYYKNLAHNAKRKYKLIYKEEFTDSIFFDIDNVLNIKEKLLNIKEGGLKGYKYDIWIETTPKMQEIIYYLGLGQNNSSLGTGTLSYITGRRC